MRCLLMLLGRLLLVVLLLMGMLLLGHVVLVWVLLRLLGPDDLLLTRNKLLTTRYNRLMLRLGLLCSAHWRVYSRLLCLPRLLHGRLKPIASLLCRRILSQWIDLLHRIHRSW